ncbi:hypothetical protein Golax_013000 [Gossypium laxum]|uniref:Uncharacterized protein n=1 Tax=Gossypium laxum TaxID=34288 RepID=A0A7J8ZRQ6_9ROSI|nr:hypothetical protein [Gossypium laxum]
MEGVMVVVKLGEVNLVVSIAILIWILIAQGYRLQLDTSAMNIHQHSLIMKVMIIQNIITVTSVRKKEIQISGFIIVQFANFLLIPTVFLQSTCSSSLEACTKEKTTHILSLLYGSLIVTLYAVNAVNPVKLWFLNVQSLHAIMLSTGKM